MIENVSLLNLKTFKDDRGFFREIFRFSTQFPDVNIGQLSHSLVNEGVVKGWHGHLHQSQWNYVLQGTAKVALKDDRQNSPTYEEIMHFETGEGQEAMGYFFPPGILHGYRCTKGPMHIIYVTSGTYDLGDEVRIEDKNISKILSR